MPDGSATAHLYFPKLATVLTEGFGLGALRKDIFAGLTVAFVALPLSMAIAVASGVAPEKGLYTAVIGGFLVSALGAVDFRSADRPALSSCWSRRRLRNSALTACC